MLVIRKTQMEALDAAAEETFLDRLVQRAITLFPHEAPFDDRRSVKTRVTVAYRRAKKYGLRAKTDVAWWVDLDFSLGPDFERAPGMEWALKIMEADLTGPTKVYRMSRRLEKLGISSEPAHA
jgi:hypothetical protein